VLLSRPALDQPLLLAFANIRPVLALIAVWRGGGCTRRCIAVRAAGCGSAAMLCAESQRCQQQNSANGEDFFIMVSSPQTNITLPRIIVQASACAAVRQLLVGMRAVATVGVKPLRHAAPIAEVGEAA